MDISINSFDKQTETEAPTSGNGTSSGVGGLGGAELTSQRAGFRAGGPGRDGQKRLIPMEYVWNSYGICMVQHRRNTGLSRQQLRARSPYQRYSNAGENYGVPGEALWNDAAAALG